MITLEDVDVTQEDTEFEGRAAVYVTIERKVPVKGKMLMCHCYIDKEQIETCSVDLVKAYIDRSVQKLDEDVREELN